MSNDLAQSYVRVLNQEAGLFDDLDSKIRSLRQLSDRMQSARVWTGVRLSDDHFAVTEKEGNLQVPLDLLEQIAVNRRALDTARRERRNIEGEMRAAGLETLIRAG